MNFQGDLVELSLNEFMEQFQERCAESLRNVYTADQPIHTSKKCGKLSTSLASDVFSLLNVQLDVVDEFLVSHCLGHTDASPTLIISLARTMVENLYDTQYRYRDSFLSTLESCCAAANDFFRMTDLAEKFLEMLHQQYKILSHQRGKPLLTQLKNELKELISIYSYDAVYAAQMTHRFVFEPIEKKLARQLFTRDWELRFTSNEIAISIVRTIDDFREDIEEYLSNVFLAKKVMDILVKATINFYTKCILMKARSTRNLFVTVHHLQKGMKITRFKDPQRAVWRMCGDIYIIKEHFIKISSKMRALRKVITAEFSPLIVILEYMTKVSEFSNADLIPDELLIDGRDLIMLLQKYIGNIRITKLVAIDLWWLIMPQGEELVFDILRTIKHSLKDFRQDDLHEDTSLGLDKRQKIAGIAFSEMLSKVYKWDLQAKSACSCTQSTTNTSTEKSLEEIAIKVAEKAKAKVTSVLQMDINKNIPCNSAFLTSTVSFDTEVCKYKDILSKLHRVV